MKITPVNVYFKGQFDIPKSEGREVLDGVQTISQDVQLESQTPEYARSFWRVNCPDELDSKVAEVLKQLGAEYTYRTNPDLALEKTPDPRPLEPSVACADE